ncbi:hypothetical protein AB0L40_19790 [Patulibacter sp. NPDC049589]|uniref:hypothetical protein n=1 Tax=Patulibacter sp. NPDC049589 TaxID=3154731 RepID=UPI0034337008
MRRPQISTTLVAAATTFALLAGAAPAGAADVVGRSFRAPVPTGWTTASTDRSGVRTFSLASKGRLSAANVPARGRLGLATLEAPLRGKGRRLSVSALADAIIGVPTGATDVRRVGRGGTKVAGAKAVSVRLTFRFRGRRIYQHDLVTRRGNRVIFIEAISDVSRRSAAVRELHTYVGGWRWR